MKKITTQLDISWAPRPLETRWTEDQWAAIAVRGGDLLVSAAAGSGKTAVLVERIVRLITDESHRVNVDELLVATFTNAAAAEMRDRIRQALEKQLAAHPQQDHLRLQLTLLQRAQITTLHSFCLEVIRRYIHLIELDPSFRMASDIESQMLRQEVLDELLEEQYEVSAEDHHMFRQLADRFTGDRHDLDLQRIILQLYDQSRTHPWPDEWLTTMAERFAVSQHEPEADESVQIWFASLMAAVRLELYGAADMLTEALKTAQEPAGPAPYIEQLHDDLQYVEQLLAATGHGWNEVHALMNQEAFGRLKACRGDQYNKTLQDHTRELRNSAKESIDKLKERLFSRTVDQYIAELTDMAPLMEELARLVIRFGETYTIAKAERGLADFSDLEHYCLQILRHEDSTPDQLIPSSAALEFREQFAEILLDEYQDTNEVQETIIALIARDQPGNRFMVGDVKQSIYRFRLAEPGLFMNKYESYLPLGQVVSTDIPQTPSTSADGLQESSQIRIDLSRNFRSRKEVVDGVNFVFRQLMDGHAGEILYDQQSELVAGAPYPNTIDRQQDNNPYSISFALLEKSTDRDESSQEMSDHEESSIDVMDSSNGIPTGQELHQDEQRELETVQMEARYIASQIHELMGPSHSASTPFTVYDAAKDAMRPVTYRDIVILLRSTKQWAPAIIEELQNYGIPAYAELSTGYFEAVEIEVMLALLNIIDNPYQDIPLAAVLRSPMFGLSADQLARIRVFTQDQRSFYDDVINYAKQRPDPSAEEVDESLRQRLSHFLHQLNEWRMDARQGALSALIWRLFSDTGYYDFVGGLPGGQQRQANLRALYDRARQFESTSYRGLFRYLRFIERLKESGGDLGTARALGEQENVVRIMTIHKSKGLEFPVVFLAGMAKRFNQQELNQSLLLHKDLGLGPMYIDPQLRLSYPTLPSLAIRQRMHMEMIAEEMRVLYVALTRAREKLYLIGTVPQVDRYLASWSRHISRDEWHLPAYQLAKATCYLDWLGPAIIRHADALVLHERAGINYRQPASMKGESSVWDVYVPPSDLWQAQAAASLVDPAHDHQRNMLAGLQPLGLETKEWTEEVHERLSWQDPSNRLHYYFAKTSVTEMKRLAEREQLAVSVMGDEYLPVDLHAGALAPADRSSLLRRPRFMEQRQLTAAERGSVFHAVMQHLPLQHQMTEEVVTDTIRSMLDRDLLTQEQAEVVVPSLVLTFFEHEVGFRLLSSSLVYREVPFSFGLPAAEAYGDSRLVDSGETVLVQGVIDCMFIEDDELVLLDYKTDSTRGTSTGQLRQRYEMQLKLYATAVERIWHKKIKGKYLYFFDGGLMIEV